VSLWRSAFGRSADRVAAAFGSATFLFALVPAFGIALGVLALLVPANAAWVESAFANGVYPQWEHAVFPITNAAPWSLGDLAVLLGIVLLVWRLPIWFRTRPKLALWRRIALTLVELIGILGLYYFWFEASWGWNYNRAPIETRVRYDPSAVTPAAVNALRRRAIAEINHLAPLAHARPHGSVDMTALYDAWLPVVRAGGDTWTPQTGAPKPTLFDPFMNATGTSGFINPLTLNVQLASDLLWFERPFDLAHEWSHVAAYAREDEANYLAIVTCTRSNDPVLAYSGWLELFLYLPPQPKYDKKTFVKLVWDDFAALRKRNAERINARLAKLSWRTYNSYLKSNHIASGVQNYNEVTRLYIGIPLDANGLPVHD
jgi:Protein of unknown function (DUF3810)